jgi:hypothetical protein
LQYLRIQFSYNTNILHFDGFTCFSPVTISFVVPISFKLVNSPSKEIYTCNLLILKIDITKVLLDQYCEMSLDVIIYTRYAI